MTRALVVFESMFGNTQMIAQAVAEGLWLEGEMLGSTLPAVGRDRPIAG